MFSIGDSKTAGASYRTDLLSNLASASPTEDFSFRYNYSASGYSTAMVAAGIDGQLAAITDNENQVAWVLINLGSNDFSGVQDGSVTESAWKTNYAHILDAVHAKFPAAQVLVAQAIRVGLESASATVNDTWLPAVLSTRSAWASIALDERVILPGHLIDATHPDATGYALTAAAWQTAMGY